VLGAFGAGLRKVLDVGIDPGDDMAQRLAPRMDRTRDIAGVAAQRGVGEEDAQGLRLVFRSMQTQVATGVPRKPALTRCWQAGLWRR